MLGNIIQKYVQAHYEGGIDKFDKDFNIFVSDYECIFSPKGDCVLPEDILEHLKQKGMGLTFIYATRSNFEGMTKEEAQEDLNAYMQGSISRWASELNISVSFAVFDVQAPNIEWDSEEGEEVISAISSIPGVFNIRIQFKDGTYLKISGSNDEPAESQCSKLATGKPDRNQIINDEDCMNLQIALGIAKNMDEFLKLV